MKRIMLTLVLAAIAWSSVEQSSQAQYGAPVRGYGGGGGYQGYSYRGYGGYSYGGYGNGGYGGFGNSGYGVYGNGGYSRLGVGYNNLNNYNPGGYVPHGGGYPGNFHNFSGPYSSSRYSR